MAFIAKLRLRLHNIGMPRAELSAKGASGKNLGRRSHKLAMDGARVSEYCSFNTAHSSYAGRDWTVRRTRNSTAMVELHILCVGTYCVGCYMCGT